MSLQTDFIYQLALMGVDGLGPVRTKTLIDHFGSAELVFEEKPSTLRKLKGIGNILANAVSGHSCLQKAEEEVEWAEKNQVQMLSFQSDAYPRRLKRCADGPVVLFYKGNIDFNPERVVGIVGTRKCTSYGKRQTEELVETLKNYKVQIVSGLAAGIDGLAHRCAVEQGLSTLGVFGTGLDRIYPTENKRIAESMLEEGGWVSDFYHGTIPDRENFPKRNRIVAGMVDALVVVESRLQGGSMITAELAMGYNRDVLAFPGKATDDVSKGCNVLIKNNKAGLILDGGDLVANQRWEKKKIAVRQTQMFAQFNAYEQKIVDALTDQSKVHIDTLMEKTGMKNSEMSMHLLTLEMNGIIEGKPGNCYALI